MVSVQSANGNIRLAIAWIIASLLLPTISRSDEYDSSADQQDLGPINQPADAIKFLKRFCLECHNEKNREANFGIHDMDAKTPLGKEIERWEKILEMVSIGDMPPKDELQPDNILRKSFLNWITEELRKNGRGPIAGQEAMPKFGNRVSHNELFSGKHQGPAYTNSRLWRISPQIYQRFASSINMARKFNAPLQSASKEGIRDYSLLYADEATIKTMLQNCKRAATTMIQGRVKTTRNRKGGRPSKQGGRTGTKHKAIAKFILNEGTPSHDESVEILNFAFEYLLHRKPDASDQERYIDSFLIPNAKIAGREIALGGLLTTIMMSPEFLFRMELGLGEQLEDGRRRLSQREIAYALSFALFDYVDPKTLIAAEKNQLSTADDVAREFRRMLKDPDRGVRGAAGKQLWITGKGAGITDARLIEASYPRMLRFFREYFGYLHVQKVFKDDTRHDGRHDPYQLIQDADWFVLGILRDDRQVFQRLLTDRNYFIKAQKSKRKSFTAPVYNIDQERSWPTSPMGFKQASVAMPENERAGMLTHPAWLSAHSGNFENDPVRRGKWIQEHLLGGIVPDIPIGVAAQLPEAPEQTLRKRFDVVKAQECWRCHKKMNPLGNPFEAYDDFGRFRKTHWIDKQSSHVIASFFESDSRIRKTRWRSTHKKKAPAETFDQRTVDTSGMLVGTDDAELDGEVAGPIDLVQRLAKSDRARQTFIRYVFRYWMGRNETLRDSPTLIAMDQAYLRSDGSFREVLVSLVSSDSFLYRK